MITIIYDCFNSKYYGGKRELRMLVDVGHAVYLPMIKEDIGFTHKELLWSYFRLKKEGKIILIEKNVTKRCVEYKLKLTV